MAKTMGADMSIPFINLDRHMQVSGSYESDQHNSRHFPAPLNHVSQTFVHKPFDTYSGGQIFTHQFGYDNLFAVEQHKGNTMDRIGFDHNYIQHILRVSHITPQL